MNNKGKDIFESNDTVAKNSLLKDVTRPDENPFLNVSFFNETSRHLNDYDSKILEEGAYKDIDDDLFQLEYKISRIEQSIKEIEVAYSTAHELNDVKKMQELQYKLNSAKNELQNLLSLYNNKTLSAKITDSMGHFFKKIFGIADFDKKVNNMYKKAFSVLPLGITSILKVRKSLSVLENINKNIDELITRTGFSGENTDKYQELSQYIVKANSIQSELSGLLNKK